MCNGKGKVAGGRQAIEKMGWPEDDGERLGFLKVFRLWRPDHGLWAYQRPVLNWVALCILQRHARLWLENHGVCVMPFGRRQYGGKYEIHGLIEPIPNANDFDAALIAAINAVEA